MSETPWPASWGWVAAAYSVWMAASGLLRLRPPRRGAALAACSLGYGAAAAAAAMLPHTLVHLFAPAAALLGGYWLSGAFFDRPQPGIERRLLALDRRLFDLLALEAHLRRAPRLLLEGLEAAYLSATAAITAGALASAAAGTAPLVQYWTLVLAAALAAYAALPWVRTRPPRVLEPPGTLARRGLAIRALNEHLLHAAGLAAPVHAAGTAAGQPRALNTLPSGHVAATLAAALAVWPVSAVLGAMLAGGSAAIACAAVAGRYHYALDVVLGAAVAWVAWLALG